MLPEHEGGHYAFRGLDEVVVVDVETTGLESDRDRVIQVSAIRARLDELAIDQHVPCQEFRSLVDPEVSISPKITQITGLTDSKLRGQLKFSDLANRLREFIGDSPIVAHNVSFDKKFLNAEFERAGVSKIKAKSFCTMKRIAEVEEKITGNRAKWRKLEEASEIFGLRRREGVIHDASEDAHIALELAAALYRRDNGLKVPLSVRVSNFVFSLKVFLVKALKVIMIITLVLFVVILGIGLFSA